MKMRNIYLLMGFLFTLTVNAQKPFEELGLENEVELLTLSDGRYVEHFINDTLRQIGSVMFNTVTNKVAYFIADDELEKMNIANRNREVSRFLSRDPLAEKYTDLSPYNFVDNSPIIYIDPDGKKIVDAMGRTVGIKIRKDKQGNYSVEFKFKKGTEQWEIDEFNENGGKIIRAMIKTKKGREIVRQVKASAAEIHYNLTDEPIKATNVEGKTQFAYGVTEKGVGAKEIVSGNNVGQFSKYEITISMGSFEFGKTPEGVEASSDPTRLYMGSEEEFLNGVGVHESTHPLVDYNVFNEGILNGTVDKNRQPVGDGSELYKALEVQPNNNEDISRKQYNEKKPK